MLFFWKSLELDVVIHNKTAVDPIISSLAIYPASEDIQDVENATIEKLDETTAYAMTDLGSYLPTQLSNGYMFGNASV